MNSTINSYCQLDAVCDHGPTFYYHWLHKIPHVPKVYVISISVSVTQLVIFPVW